MKIFIQYEKVIKEFDVTCETTISELKEKIKEAFEIKESQFYIIDFEKYMVFKVQFMGKEHCLSDYHVREGQIFCAVAIENS